MSKLLMKLGLIASFFGPQISFAAGDGGGGEKPSSLKKKRNVSPSVEGKRVTPEINKRTQPHLMLNLDVNKTLILLDPAAGKNVNEMLQSILSESTWGLEDQDGNWEILSGYESGDLEPSLSKPEGIVESEDLELKTYSDYLENGMFKLKEIPEGISSQLKDQIKVLNGALKGAKQSLKSTFIEKVKKSGELVPGLGISINKYYQQMKESYRLQAEGQEHSAVKRAFEEAFPELKGENFFILPSFFELINDLRRKGRSFSIIFRTFGHDIHKVTDETSSFLVGRHPIFELEPAAEGFYQTEAGKIFGCFERSGEGTKLHVNVSELADKAEATEVIEGEKDIYGFMKYHSLQGTHLSFTDHYKHWANHSEDSSAGKIHPIYPNDKDVHSIFIDDNVETDYAHIVHVLDLEKNEEVPFELANGLWMVKADPMNALLNKRYFVDVIESCEAKLKAFHSR